MVFHTRATVLGRLTDDPKLTYHKSRKRPGERDLARAEFKLFARQEAHSRRGEKLTIRCVAFGVAAEVIADQRIANSYMLVAGRLLSRIFKDDDGKHRHDVFLVVEDFSFIPNPEGRFIRGHVLVTKADRDRWRAIEDEFGIEFVRRKAAGTLKGLSDKPEWFRNPKDRTGPNRPGL